MNGIRTSNAKIQNATGGCGITFRRTTIDHSTVVVADGMSARRGAGEDSGLGKHGQLLSDHRGFGFRADRRPFGSQQTFTRHQLVGPARTYALPVGCLAVMFLVSTISET